MDTQFYSLLLSSGLLADFESLRWLFSLDLEVGFEAIAWMTGFCERMTLYETHDNDERRSTDGQVDKYWAHSGAGRVR